VLPVEASKTTMIQTLRSRVPRNPHFLGAITFILLIGMLIACFRPFNAPKNAVSWVTGTHAIAFGRHGVLLSSDALTMPGSQDASSSSLELWIQPVSTRIEGSILGIYSAENPRQFSIYQERTDLSLSSAFVYAPVHTDGPPSFTRRVFTAGKPVFVTITSDEQGTNVYTDGALRITSPPFRITNRMLTGKLVLGTAAVEDNSWPGQLRGLAIYSRALSAEQVLEHYTSWTRNGRPDIGDTDGPLALYLFDEGTGSRLRSAVPGGSDLYVPERFFVPAKGFLLPPSLDDWSDIVNNIIGFMPLGFTLCGTLMFVGGASRRTSQRTWRPVILTAVICGVLSLLIESLQYFLPTRDSSSTDVITNLLGGAIGALLYRWCVQDQTSALAMSPAEATFPEVRR
jgi:hypothetical protein